MGGTVIHAEKTTEILFQAFPWDAQVEGQKHVWYRHLQTKLPNLREAGMTHVWFPPMSKSVDVHGYLPGDLYDLGKGPASGENRTLYGNQEELKQAVAQTKKLGMIPVADAVLNHRCASHQEDGVWNVFRYPSGKANWRRWALVRGDGYKGTGAPDTGGDLEAAPDVDHSNEKVRADIKAWMQWIQSEIGFEGVRFDYSKGYSSQYAAEYAQSMQSKFSVGEYWTDMSYHGSTLLPNQDSHRQQLADWVDGTKGAVSAFDFTTKGLLQEALEHQRLELLRGPDARAAGFLGWWPERAVTFIDNHDTGSTQAHWPFPKKHVLAGYAYILTHPGTPTVFWDHLFEWGESTRKMIVALSKLRHEAGIHSASPLVILEARNDLYAATIGETIALKLGKSSWSPGPRWKRRLAGPQFTVWQKIEPIRLPE